MTTTADESGTPVGRELEAIKRFPEGNPNPVLQVDRNGVLLYANPASAELVEELGLAVGAAIPERLAQELADAVTFVPTRPVEARTRARTYSIVAVEAPELNVTNLYATDVTAAEVLERFPTWNPNPVLRIDRDGSLLFANAASAPIVEALGSQSAPGSLSRR